MLRNFIGNVKPHFCKLWKYKPNTSTLIIDHFIIKYKIHGMVFSEIFPLTKYQFVSIFKGISIELISNISTRSSRSSSTISSRILRYFEDNYSVAIFCRKRNKYIVFAECGNLAETFHYWRFLSDVKCIKYCRRT